LFTFYDFPAQHWSHLRTTNPIESTFATVRLRTQRTKGCGSRIATLTMVFKLGIEAQKHWRRLNGSALLPKIGHRRPIYRWRGTTRTSCLTVINRGCAYFPYTTFDNISELFPTWSFESSFMGSLGPGCSGRQPAFNGLRNSGGSPRPMCSSPGRSSDRYQPPRRSGGSEILSHDDSG
jgi:hypothetical protein